jgi:hypothetical protein
MPKEVTLSTTPWIHVSGLKELKADTSVAYGGIEVRRYREV